MKVLLFIALICIGLAFARSQHEEFEKQQHLNEELEEQQLRG